MNKQSFVGMASALLMAAHVAPAGASALSDAAAALQPGQWVQLSTQNFNSALLDDGASYDVFYYSEDMTWDPVTRQLLFVGGGHASDAEFLRYSEDTNTWQRSKPTGASGTATSRTPTITTRSFLRSASSSSASRPTILRIASRSTTSRPRPGRARQRCRIARVAAVAWSISPSSTVSCSPTAMRACSCTTSAATAGRRCRVLPGATTTILRSTARSTRR